MSWQAKLIKAGKDFGPCGDSRDPVTPVSLQTTSVISRRPHRPGDNRLVCSSLLRQSCTTESSSTPRHPISFYLSDHAFLLILPPNHRPEVPLHCTPKDTPSTKVTGNPQSWFDTGDFALGLYVEEEKRPSPILSSPLLDPTQLSAAHQPTGFPPGKQNTVSSATLNGRWYLQVPAAWGRAVLLPSSSTAEPSPATHRSKRDQFSDGSTEIQYRHPLPLPISCPKPGCGS